VPGQEGEDVPRFGGAFYLPSPDPLLGPHRVYADLLSPLTPAPFAFGLGRSDPFPRQTAGEAACGGLVPDPLLYQGFRASNDSWSDRSGSLPSSNELGWDTGGRFFREVPAKTVSLVRSCRPASGVSASDWNVPPRLLTWRARMEFLYPWAGLAVGFLMGLTGIGAGSVMTPLLIIVFQMPPTVAVHLSLVYASVTKVFGAWAHMRAGNVDFPLVRRMAIGSIPGVLLGSALVAYGVVAHPERIQALLRHGIGWALLLAAVTVLARPWWQGRPAVGWLRTQAVRWRLGPVVCFGVGLLVGVTSIGSGSMFTPLLVHGTSLPSRRIVGTVLVHALLITAVGAAFHSWITPLHGKALVLILLGSLPGVLLGSRLTLRVPERVLSGLIGGALLMAGLRMV
jgi:uncharacterized membrane protein YfcA